MKKVSPENQNLAQFVGKVFGGDWSMAAHNDENGQAVVYTLAGKDKTKPGVLSHATIGLSDYQLGQDKSGISLGAELVCGGYERFDYIDLALANAARFVMGNSLKFKPGTIFANLLSDFDDNSQMNHILFAVPSLWNNQLYPLQFQTKTVLWLQAIPISDSEKEYGEQHGPDALGNKLTGGKIDLYDLRRESVV